MTTTHDDIGEELSTVMGILGVRAGGTGADLRLTGGSGHVVRQSSVGAALTTGPLSYADLTGAPEIYISPTGADQTAVLQAALDVAGPKRIRIGPGTFVVTETPRVSTSGTVILGTGMDETVLTLVPTAGGHAAIEFSNGASSLFECELGEMTIYSPELTFQKDAVRLIDVSYFYLHDIEITNWLGNTSVGLRIKGRDFISIHRVFVNDSDQAVKIEANPNASISLDHMDFGKALLKSNSTRPVIEVATGCNLTSNKIHGQAWIGGSAGFQFIDTTTAQVSGTLSISDCRREQATGGGLMVDFESNTAFRQLVLDRLWNGSLLTEKGYKLRGVDIAHILNCQYLGTSEALNVNGTVGVLNIQNTFFLGGSTISMTGMTKIKHEGSKRDNTEPTRPSELWMASTNPNLAVALRSRDASFGLFDDADETKVAQFNATGVTTGTTRTMRIPNADATLGGTLARAGTVSTTAVTTVETLWTYSLPANSLASETIVIRAMGSFAANANTKSVVFNFGATTLPVNDITTAPNGVSWMLMVEIVPLSGTSQNLGLDAKVGTVAQSVRTAAAAATASGAITISITGQNGTASAGDITLINVRVECR